MPDDWSAYSNYGKVDKITDPSASGPFVKVRILEDKKLAAIDPLQWPEEYRYALFDNGSLSGNWSNITINGLDAKRISVETLEQPKDVIYALKGDVAFTISNEASDQPTFHYILSTFKIFDR